MIIRESTSLIRLVAFLSASGTAAGLALLAVRTGHSISFREPLQLMTAGAEFESLYAFWKYVHGLVVYGDHFKIPFAGSFYNWLYYGFYGEIIRHSMNVFDLNDPWLPTIARLVTLVGAVLGTFFAYRCFADFVGRADRPLRMLFVALAALVFVGPLSGYFAIASQPDIWGAALEVTAIYLFLRLYRKHSICAIVVFAVAAYCAWSFKQVLVYSIGTVGMFLVLRRQWTEAFLLTGLICGAFVATLAFASEQYVKNIVSFGGVTVLLSIEMVIRNVANAGVKLLPIAFGLVSIGVLALAQRRFGVLFASLWRRLTDPSAEAALPITALGFVITGCLAIPASAKLGAAENYYFSLAFFASLLLVQTLMAAGSRLFRGTAYAAIAIGFVLHCVAIASVFLGIQGSVAPRVLYGDIVKVRDCLVSLDLPEPIFLEQPYLALPWMYPANLHFVLQNNYRWDTVAKIPMEGGGLGGLMDAGFFRTLVMADEIKEFDGSDLRRYGLTDEHCDVLRIYRRSN